MLLETQHGTCILILDLPRSGLRARQPTFVVSATPLPGRLLQLRGLPPRMFSGSADFGLGPLVDTDTAASRAWGTAHEWIAYTEAGNAIQYWG